MSNNPLQQLHTQMLACRRCPDAGYEVTPPAIVHGQLSSWVMIIGQAPGVTEAQARRPFNAGSGRRLFHWLAEAGWDEDDFRARHAMTAVTRCYPGKNNSGRGDRVPTKEEQALCRPNLEQEIALVRPRLIIPVGGLAIRLFYPASAKLNGVIGTAAYFPPEALTNPLNFDLGQAEVVTAFDPGKPADGRWVVPLPHPSGASLWPNRPANQKLIEQALRILGKIREAWDL